MFMFSRLLSTLSWLSGDSTTSPTAAEVLAAPSDTMPRSRWTRSVTQATLRMSELHHAAPRNKPSWGGIGEATCKACCSMTFAYARTVQLSGQATASEIG